MFTPMSIISLDHGKDLAHWHIRALYDAPIDFDVDRSKANAAAAVAGMNVVNGLAERRPLLSLLVWFGKTTLPVVARLLHRKGCEIPAA